jgi:SAM-dependent methyltransferase
MSMSDAANGNGTVPGDRAANMVRYQKKDFWSGENLRYSQPHFRMEKAALIVKRIAHGEERSLLDIGCGPATLARLLPRNIRYHGIDIAIHDPAPNLIEADLVGAPIRFNDQRFDIVIAQGFFEYVGDVQSQKFAEIARLLHEKSKFIVSYVNFGHRERDIYSPYNNVQTFDDFRTSLARHFEIRRFFPTSHNWSHREPSREPIKAINMRVNMHIPFISPVLAVQYFFICSRRD